MIIEQAMYARHGVECRLLARSPGFLDDWLSASERLCIGFGVAQAGSFCYRPAGVSCPPFLFAQPLGKHHVAVVQASDFRVGEVALRFHIYVIKRADYLNWLIDPFLVADYFPFPPDSPRELGAISWRSESPPMRTVPDIQRILKRAEGPALLGAAQALVDGGRVVFERPDPESTLIRDLWTLLPTRTRSELWPASFAFGNDLGFHALVVPQATGDTFHNYVTEDQAASYPEGGYELNLQIAAENGNQGELNELFARRSRAQTWRLGLILLGFVLLLALGMGLLQPGPKARNSATTKSAATTTNGKH